MEKSDIKEMNKTKMSFEKINKLKLVILIKKTQKKMKTDKVKN